MKNILLTACIAALSLTACDSKSGAETTAATPAATTEATGCGEVAYVQVEAVLAQSDLFLTEGAALQAKTEKAQKSWAQKEQNLQYEAAQLQEKYQKGLITTNDAQAQQQSIEKRVAAYQSSAQKEAQTLDEENYVFNNRAQGLIHRAIRAINADGRYKLIVNASASSCWPSWVWFLSTCTGSTPCNGCRTRGTTIIGGDSARTLPRPFFLVRRQTIRPFFRVPCCEFGLFL